MSMSFSDKQQWAAALEAVVKKKNTNNKQMVSRISSSSGCHLFIHNVTIIDQNDHCYYMTHIVCVSLSNVVRL